MSEKQGRRPMVAANWKMNKLRKEAWNWCQELLAELGEESEVVVFPSFPLLPDVTAALRDSTVAVGGQDVHPKAKGAFTGDVSAPQLIDAGCTWVLAGHSERRHGHGEGDILVAQKVEAAARHGLTPMICLGETAEERSAGKTFEVLGRQLAAVLVDFPGDLAFAYEPVWAIGTGETATPEIAQEAHAFLRRTLVESLGEEQAGWIRILYGGSVNPENAASLAAQPDIDGFLVGGASLDAKKFLAIIRQAAA
jgi:triosephosphate isomerase